jgi:hypothetical protein
VKYREVFGKKNVEMSADSAKVDFVETNGGSSKMF